MPYATRQSFLLALSDALRPLATPTAIRSAACTMLAEQLMVEWVGYLEFDGADLVVRTASDPSGPLRQEVGRPVAFGSALLDAYRRGERLAIQDVTTDPRLDETQRRSALGAGIHSIAGATLVQDGRWIGALAAQHETPRRWSAPELDLLQESAARVAIACERAAVQEALAGSERRLAAELAGARTLAEISTRLISESRPEALYSALAEAAMELMGSDFASLQMLEEDGATLRLLAWRNFHPDSAAFWSRMEAGSPTACGMALHQLERVVVRDVEQEEAVHGTPHLEEFRRSGIRSVQSTPLVSRAGRVVGMISTHWRRPAATEELDFRHLDVLARQAADLIERTSAQAALRTSEARLQEADRRKDEFIAVLAHELRNPLAPLRTGLELLRLAGSEPQTIESVRAMMERQIVQMVRLIDDLLDVSRITAGRIQLRRQPSELAILVGTAVEANRAPLQERQLDLYVDLPAAPTWLNVDPARFVQILSNVLHNAVKFTPPGGKIDVVAKVERRLDGVEELRLAVADTGSGISPETLPRVFELFTQGEAAHANGGLGIGLALARRLIEMHGGTIDAASEGAGRGSRFTLHAPVIVAAPDADLHTRHPRPDAASRRVLIVDDNVDAATSLAMLVAELGGSAQVAGDGERGIELAREFRPEVVLLDIGMPGLDGYETCRRMRIEHGEGPVIVALTGWGQERDKDAAARAGFDVHLTKPAHPLALEALLAGERPASERRATEPSFN